MDCAHICIMDQCSLFISGHFFLLLSCMSHVEVKYIGFRFVQTLVKKIVQNIASITITSNIAIL